MSALNGKKKHTVSGIHATVGFVVVVPLSGPKFDATFPETTQFRLKVHACSGSSRLVNLYLCHEPVDDELSMTQYSVFRPIILFSMKFTGGVYIRKDSDQRLIISDICLFPLARERIDHPKNTFVWVLAQHSVCNLRMSRFMRVEVMLIQFCILGSSPVCLSQT